jgi:hypothetical protein
VLEDAEVLAGWVVESVGRHRAPSIDRLAALLDPASHEQRRRASERRVVKKRRHETARNEAEPAGPV